MGVVRRRNHNGIEIQIRLQHFSVIPERCGVLVLIGRVLQVTVIHITQGDHVFMPHGSKVGRASVADPDDAQAQPVAPEPGKISMTHEGHGASEQ